MNHKIKNAVSLSFNGIRFKSKLEVNIYKKLTEEGFKVLYEPFPIILWRGFKPTVPFYTRDKKTRGLKLDNKKIIDIKYTPDFYIKYKNKDIFIEAKGFENDVFYIKKKMFRHYLETSNPNSLYFEIFTLRELKEAIKIIKDETT